MTLDRNLLEERRIALVKHARSRCETLDRLMDSDLCSTGSVVFQGCRRDSVGAVASTWAASHRHSVSKTISIPNAGDSHAIVSDFRVEIDLENVASTNRSAVVRWVAGVVQQQNVSGGPRIVCIHGAHTAPKNSLSRILRTPSVILIASTSVPDCGSLRSLGGAIRMRVPCPLNSTWFLSHPAVQKATSNPSPASIRAAVTSYRCAGFLPTEASVFLFNARGRATPDSVELAANADARVPKQSGDERPLEVVFSALLNCTEV